MKPNQPLLFWTQWFSAKRNTATHPSGNPPSVGVNADDRSTGEKQNGRAPFEANHPEQPRSKRRRSFGLGSSVVSQSPSYITDFKLSSASHLVKGSMNFTCIPIHYNDGTDDRQVSNFSRYGPLVRLCITLPSPFTFFIFNIRRIF